MKHTRRRDRLAELHFWRWHGVPVMAALYIGKLRAERPPWHIVAATVALQCILIYGAVGHVVLAPLRNPAWTVWP